MPWVILGLLVVGFAIYEVTKPKSPLGTPRPIPGNKPQPGPAPPGVVPTAPGPAGSLTVVVQPGDMGTLTVASGPSGPSVNVQTPTGYFLSMTSSNPNVVSVLPIDPSGHTAGVTLGGAVFPGSAVISALWVDGTGTQRSTTFTIVGT